MVSSPTLFYDLDHPITIEGSYFGQPARETFESKRWTVRPDNGNHTLAVLRREIKERFGVEGEVDIYDSDDQLRTEDFDNASELYRWLIGERRGNKRGVGFRRRSGGLTKSADKGRAMFTDDEILNALADNDQSPARAAAALFYPGPEASVKFSNPFKADHTKKLAKINARIEQAKLKVAREGLSAEDKAFEEAMLEKLQREKLKVQMKILK